MSAGYRHVAVADVKPGMVLYDVLLDKHGQVLLPQGATLTAALIALLPRHGIEVLAVLKTADADPAALATERAAIARRLAWLFRKYDSENSADWATGALRRNVEHYRLGREAEP